MVVVREEACSLRLQCKRKGHSSEACWVKFSEKAQGYVAPPPPKEKPREPTPAPNKKKRGRRSKSQDSDRVSDYDASASEAESPHRNRRRYRSNRVKVVQEDQRNTPMEGAGSSNSDYSFYGRLPKLKIVSSSIG